jgi:hypothetical protein
MKRFLELVLPFLPFLFGPFIQLSISVSVSTQAVGRYEQKNLKNMDMQELEQESQELEEDSLKLYIFLVQYVRKHKSKENPKDFTQQALNECTTITGPNRVRL